MNMPDSQIGESKNSFASDKKIWLAYCQSG